MVYHRIGKIQYCHNGTNYVVEKILKLNLLEIKPFSENNIQVKKTGNR